MSVKVKVVGIEKVQQRFRDMANRANSPNTALEVIGAKGFKNVIKHFSDEASPDGRWKGLKRIRKRGGSKLLQDTGRMRLSNGWRVVGRDVYLYNSANYSVYHNYGAPKANIPQRKFLWVDSATIKSMIITLLKYIKDGKTSGV